MAPRASAARPRTLAGRLLLWHVVAVLGVLLVLGLVVGRELERYFVDQVTDALAADARAVREALPSSEPIQAEVVRLGRALGARVTVIRTDGEVVADSDHDPATMENHRGRPEIRQALDGEIGVASRPSETSGISYRYLALPPDQGRIVRVALPLTAVRSRLATIRLILAAGFGIAAVAGLVVLALITRSLSRPLRRMSASVDRGARGDLSAEVGEEGSREMVTLARAVNRMREEVASRLGDLERERSTREAILSALEEGVTLFAEDGTILYQNDSATRLIGPIERLHQVVPARLRATVQAVAVDRTRRTVEVHAGPSRALAATALAIPGDHGVLLVLRDVTEAWAVDAVRRDFVANASHELKTPAASIRALAETIHGAAADDPQAVPRFADQLDREAARLSRIISDLLDLSRLEGEMGLRVEVRLDRVAAVEARRAAAEGRRAGLRLTVSADRPAVVRGSRRDLGLLVRNLVENAIQHTRSGGRVEVEVHQEDRHAVLVVRDTGIGIPKRDQTRVFERFYRVDRARSRETGGTGLGLSIVKHVAENHGGSVGVDSRLGEGSTFTVRLPLATPSS